jgi:hypothetical protein
MIYWMMSSLMELFWTGRAAKGTSLRVSSGLLIIGFAIKPTISLVQKSESIT